EEKPHLHLVTGFYIPSGIPPAYETDGPLGALFLARAIDGIGGGYSLNAEEPIRSAFVHAMSIIAIEATAAGDDDKSIVIAIERSGPALDGKCYTMRGRDISSHIHEQNNLFDSVYHDGTVTIGIGDGGNEIGMGKIPHEIVAREIPNGDLIHCRVPTDHLIVAGV